MILTSWDILVGRVQPIHIEEYSVDSGDENPFSMGPTIVSTMWALKTILLQGWNGTHINGQKFMGFIGVITPICRSYKFVSYEPVYNRFFGPFCRFLCFHFKPTLLVNTVPPSTNRSNHVRSWKRWIWRPAWHVFNFAWMWWKHPLMRTGGEQFLKLLQRVGFSPRKRWVDWSDDPFPFGWKGLIFRG